jgi:hypothetical protein
MRNILSQDAIKGGLSYLLVQKDCLLNFLNIRGCQIGADGFLDLYPSLLRN